MSDTGREAVLLSSAIELLSRTMGRWRIAIVCVVLLMLVVASAAPWMGYWVGLSKIEGRPAKATGDAAIEEVDHLFKQLRISEPFRLEPMSPYSVFLQGARPNDSARVAWLIARSHNIEHLDDRRYWHLSGAALTIWLTRNWTTAELVATAANLEDRAAKRRPPNIR